MSFSFSTTAGASQSSTRPRLAGNEIYTVKFDGCEIVDIKGVKDPDKVYKVLKIKFSNNDGTYEHTIFEPRQEDFTRGENEYTDKNGVKGKIPQPSGVENMMLLFKHAIDIINPTIAKQIDEGTKNLGASNWDGLRELVSKILNAGKGATCQIKLLKNSKGEATFPGYFSGLTKPDPITGKSKAYIRNNFIGEKLSFSTYENQRIAKELEAKPTRINSFSSENELSSPNGFSSNDNDLDFEIPTL